MYSTHQVLLEDESEDQLLARALEESRKFYSEVELPRLSQVQNQGQQNWVSGSSHEQKEAEPKGQLWNTYSEQEDETVEEEKKGSCSLASPRPREIASGSHLHSSGFDLVAGQTWIYPTNYPMRDYQFNIVKKALFRNTLVSLPTGLGKTFIAAVVMYNFYRWFPQGKIIFLAPTKPLVHQQIDSCYKVMGIPKSDTAEMTGAMPPSDREAAWVEQRLFFLTPQVVTNDLSRGICPAHLVKCIVFDEAHKAIGNYAYCQVMKTLLPFNQEFRVLALSATPGSGIDAVRKVIQNLHISHLEIRSEQSIDIGKYTHHRTVDTVIVKLEGYHKKIQDQYMSIVNFYLRRLFQSRVVHGNTNNMNKFRLLCAREEFHKHPPPGLSRSLYGNIESDFAMCLSLYHGLELLTIHGLRSFVRYFTGILDDEQVQSAVKFRLAVDNQMLDLLNDLKEKLGPLDMKEPFPNDSVLVEPQEEGESSYIHSHPKMKHLCTVVVQHFKSFQERGAVTRVMIFCQYRDTVIEVCHVLSKYNPLVKPMTFVGQSSGKQSRGFSQKQQLMVMRKFREGGYNTLISTCVGEEGLDIGDVDLIVCFDAHNSPIRLVQRMGRTGRNREGRIVMLVTDGKEYQKYRQSVTNQDRMNRNLTHGQNLQLVESSPRMIPEGIQPKCQQQFMTMPKESTPKTKKKRNQDLRVMFARQNKKKSTTDTIEDQIALNVEDMNEALPTFNMIPETQFLHSLNKEELHSVYSCNEDSGKVALNRNTDYITENQDKFSVCHSTLSEDLIALLKLSHSKRDHMPQTQTAALASQLNDGSLWARKKRKRQQADEKKKSKRESKADASEPQVHKKSKSYQNRLTTLWSNIAENMRNHLHGDKTESFANSGCKKIVKKGNEHLIKHDEPDCDIVSEVDGVCISNDTNNLEKDCEIDLPADWAYVEKLICDLQSWQSQGGHERACCIFEPVLQCSRLLQLAQTEETDVRTHLKDIVLNLPDPEHIVSMLDADFLETFDIRNLGLPETHNLEISQMCDVKPYEQQNDIESVSVNPPTCDVHLLDQENGSESAVVSIIESEQLSPVDHSMKLNFCLGISQLFDYEVSRNSCAQPVCYKNEDIKKSTISLVAVCDDQSVTCNSKLMKEETDGVSDNNLQESKEQVSKEESTMAHCISKALNKWMEKEEKESVSSPKRLFSPKAPSDLLKTPGEREMRGADFSSYSHKDPFEDECGSYPDLAVSPILCGQKPGQLRKNTKNVVTSTPRILRRSLFTTIAGKSKNNDIKEKDHDEHAAELPPSPLLENSRQSNMTSKMASVQPNQELETQKKQIDFKIKTSHEKQFVCPDIKASNPSTSPSLFRPPRRFLKLTSSKFKKKVPVFKTKFSNYLSVNDSKGEPSCPEVISQVNFNLFDDLLFNDKQGENANNCQTPDRNKHESNALAKNCSSQLVTQKSKYRDSQLKLSLQRGKPLLNSSSLQKNSTNILDEVVDGHESKMSDNHKIVVTSAKETLEGSPPNNSTSSQAENLHNLEDSNLLCRKKNSGRQNFVESSETECKRTSPLNMNSDIIGVTCKQNRSESQDHSSLCFSSDEEVFVAQPIMLSKGKQSNVECSLKPKKRCSTSNNKNEKMKRIKKPKLIEDPNEFIELEAEESLDQKCHSSDDEDTSGLDELDDSFVDDSNNEAPFQDSVDLHAQYLQSVRSPLKHCGHFKMPAYSGDKVLQPDVFSQEDIECNESYEQDSFCVDDNEEGMESNAQDTLDIIEAVLEKEVCEHGENRMSHRKRKRSSNLEVGVKKRRRRIQQFSSESEDERPILPPTQVQAEEVSVVEINNSPSKSNKEMENKMSNNPDMQDINLSSCNMNKEWSKDSLKQILKLSITNVKGTELPRNLSNLQKTREIEKHHPSSLSNRISLNSSHEIRESDPVKEIKDKTFVAACSGKKGLNEVTQECKFAKLNACDLKKSNDSVSLTTIHSDGISTHNIKKYISVQNHRASPDFPGLSKNKNVKECVEDSLLFDDWEEWPDIPGDGKNKHLKSTVETSVIEEEVANLQDLCVESWEEDDFVCPTSQSLLAPTKHLYEASRGSSRTKPLQNKQTQNLRNLNRNLEFGKHENNKYAQSADYCQMPKPIAPVTNDVRNVSNRGTGYKYPAVSIAEPSNSLKGSSSSKGGVKGINHSNILVNSNHTVAEPCKSDSSTSVIAQGKTIEGISRSPINADKSLDAQKAKNATANENKANIISPGQKLVAGQGLVVIVSSRQVSSVLEVITALKANHQISVDIRSMSVAHFVLSWRLGVVRITLADLMQSGTWATLEDTIKKLRSLFRLPYVAVENHHTPLCSYQEKSSMWSNRSFCVAEKLLSLGVKVFFSDSQVYTAHLLSQLSQKESKQGYNIVLPGPTTNVRIVMKFLETLPGVNIALAMKLCLRFTTVDNFIKNCNSVSNIQQMMGVNRESAKLIQSLFYSVMV